MNNLENVSLDTNTKEQKKSVLENCDCAPDCCDTTKLTNEVCCQDNKSDNCCTDVKDTDCCTDSEKNGQDYYAPTKSTSCCDNSSDDACHDSGDSSCCGDEKTSAKIEEGIATIDGKKVEVTSSDTNLVELAKKINITIPAPCYFAKRKGGCCNACVVEVNGKQEFACGTTPQKGMNITVNRPDLKALRKERILKYTEVPKSGNPVACSTK